MGEWDDIDYDEVYFKVCHKCKHELPLELFYKAKGKKHGVTTLCKFHHNETNKPHLKKWMTKNKDKRNEYQKKYIKQRKKTDPAYAMLIKLRVRQRMALKGKTKHAHTLELLGADPKDVWKSLKAGFLKRYGRPYSDSEDVHVDHIKPCASFNMRLLAEQKKCFHWTNLQLLTAEDNLKKGSKWND